MHQWWSAKLRPTTRARRRYIAARANSPLYRYSRIYLLYPAAILTSCYFSAAAASRRWSWRNAASTWPKQIYRDRTCPHPACFVRCPKLERLETQLNFSVRDTRARATCISLLPVPNCHTDFLTFLRSSPPFFSRALPASRLLLRTRLCTCRRASAVTRWAQGFRRCYATSIASAATASTAARTTRNSTA
jgi:hypothetical protein